jgi:phosphohistidine swiveling domain-containing protein
MKNSSKQSVHFSVDGEDLTRIARDMMLSDLPTNAWRVLSKGLIGPTQKIVESVLDGHQKFVGNEIDGIKNVPDNAASYQKALRYIYAGRVKIGFAWYRPRAEVKMYGPEDARYVTEKVESTDPETLSAGLNVIKEAEGEKAVRVGNRVIIFELCRELPFWWTERKDVESALASFLNVGKTLMGLYADENEKGAYPLTDDAWWKRQAEEESDWQNEIARRNKFASRVMEQAGLDLFDLKDENGVIVAKNVPRAPFERWALQRTSMRRFAPRWKTVSPTGMKLPMDDPNHTDWWLAIGGDPSKAYKGPIYDAAVAEIGRIQERYGQYRNTVIVDGPVVEGVIGEEVIVLKDLHPDQLPLIEKARAVITEAGGQLAHLAVVALGRGIPIILVPLATEIFQTGTRVCVDTKEGKVQVL